MRMKNKWEKHYQYALENLDLAVDFGADADFIWRKIFKMAVAISLQENIEFEDDMYRQGWTEAPNVLVLDSNGTELQEKNVYQNTIQFLFEWYFQKFEELPIGFAFSSDNGLDYGF
jgi:hypothetical protein